MINRVPRVIKTKTNVSVHSTVLCLSENMVNILANCKIPENNKFLISLFRVGSLGIKMKALLYCLGEPALLRVLRGGNCDTILLPTNRRPRDGTVVSTKPKNVCLDFCSSAIVLIINCNVHNNTNSAKVCKI